MLNEKNGKEGDTKYLTQGQLAQRWLSSQSTIKSMRDRGELPFFQPPGSIKILYPIDQIELIEHENTENLKKEVEAQKQPTEMKRKMPVDSSNIRNDWRI